MAPKIEAVLALEASVGHSIAAGWLPIARAKMAEIGQAVARGRFTDAYDACASLTLTSLVERQRRRLEELGVAAVLLGASRLQPLQLTSLMTGERPLPQVIATALDQLTVMLEDDAADRIRTAAANVVALAEETRHQAEMSVFKSELDLADALNAAVLGNGRGLIDVGANLVTSRLVSYGFLDQALTLNLETYQVTEILDGRHCPVCEFMHGKTFRVAREAARVEQVLQILDPAELRSAAPWPKQDAASLQQLRSMSAGELQAAGFGSPPYHPGCRGQLVPSGTVVEVLQAKPPVSTQGASGLPVFGQPVEPAPKKPPPAKPSIGTDLGELELRALARLLPDPVLRGHVLAALDDDDLAMARALLLTAPPG